ncbi:MAG: hypothetical protein NVSMB22_22840 [Chloroflexota bacterium]
MRLKPDSMLVIQDSVPKKTCTVAPLYSTTQTREPEDADSENDVTPAGTPDPETLHPARGRWVR